MASIEGDKPFVDLANESNYKVRPVNKIKALDENLPGLSNQRAIVQWAFNEDTETGDIKRFNVNNGYAIVQLTAKYKEGVMAVEDASAEVLPIIRKQRKAAQIIAQHKGKSFDDLPANTGQALSTATSLTVKAPTIPGSGSEPVVVGTAFAMAEGDTSELIEGNTGVFMIKVTKKEEGPTIDNYSTYANTLKTTASGKVNSAVYNALKEASEIEDKRDTFY
jgi:peptidyl-prolyl cis-trans isomerase D